MYDVLIIYESIVSYRYNDSHNDYTNEKTTLDLLINGLKLYRVHGISG